MVRLTTHICITRPQWVLNTTIISVIYICSLNGIISKFRAILKSSVFKFSPKSTTQKLCNASYLMLMPTDNIPTCVFTHNIPALIIFIVSSTLYDLVDWFSPALCMCFRMSLQWHLKSPASRVFAQPFFQAQIIENVKAQRQWPWWGEFTGDPWIPLTKGQ